MLEVVQPGLFSTIQDRGRPGYYAKGVPPSGAMDLVAHDVANALVGNEPPAATIEMTYVGATLTFRDFSLIAVTGARMDATLDGVSVPPWTSQIVRAGQTLRFGPMLSGVRAYVGVRGGIDVPLVMSSRSTYTSSGLGGHHGRALVAGDTLAVGDLAAPGVPLSGGRQVPDHLVPEYPTELDIRVVGGLCDYRLTDEASEGLYGSSFSLSTEANRTGYRLEGERLTFRPRDAPFGAGADPSNVVNLGYPVGSIQSPSGSELIVLLRDAVTGGGYATIGTVISADLDLLAQAKSPDRVRFTRVGVDVALEARAARATRIGRISELLGRT